MDEWDEDDIQDENYDDNEEGEEKEVTEHEIRVSGNDSKDLVEDGEDDEEDVVEDGEDKDEEGEE